MTAILVPLGIALLLTICVQVAAHLISNHQPPPEERPIDPTYDGEAEF